MTILTKLAQGLQRLVPRRGVRIKTGAYGLKYLLFGASSLDGAVARHGLLPEWIDRPEKQLVPTDGVIFDVGANAGFLTLVFAALHAPQGRVFAYEPDPSVFAQLAINIELNGRRENMVALQDSPDRSATLTVRRTLDGTGRENRGLSSLEPIALHRTHEITVPASTVDREVEYKGLDRLDLLKIDVESADLRVLKGATATLSRFRPIIHYESSPTIDTLAGIDNSAGCFRLLDSLHYRHFELIGEEKPYPFSGPHPTVGDANILAILAESVPGWIDA